VPEVVKVIIFVDADPPTASFEFLRAVSILNEFVLSVVPVLDVVILAFRVGHCHPLDASAWSGADFSIQNVACIPSGASSSQWIQG
jgi:hypothetical protein